MTNIHQSFLCSNSCLNINVVFWYGIKLLVGFKGAVKLAGAVGLTVLFGWVGGCWVIFYHNFG